MSSALDELVTRVAAALESARWKLATAESCTGGLIAATLTERAGSSRWFDQSWVTYSNDSKIHRLGVPAGVIAQFGAVSEPVVLAMAEGGLARSEAQVVVAVSGIAGPEGGSAAKPVGTVCFGWADRYGHPSATTRRFAGDRQAVRMQAVEAALLGVLGCLDQLKKDS